MEALLVKVFATALALSLVMTRPDAVKTQFDPAADKAEVQALLSAGCDAVKKSFDIATDFDVVGAQQPRQAQYVFGGLERKRQRVALMGELGLQILYAAPSRQPLRSAGLLSLMSRRV